MTKKINPINVAIFNDTNTDTSNHYGCSLVMYNLVHKLKQNNLNPVFFWPVGVDWRDHKELIKKNFNFFAIIVNGEGTIHHNKEKEKANYIVEIAEFAKNELKIPAYLINTTLHENTQDLYKKIIYFENVYVRESSTKGILKEQGIESNIIPDLTFAAPINLNGQKRSANSYLITDSTFNDLRGKLKNFSTEIGWEYVSMKVRQEQSFTTKYARKFQKLSKKKNLSTLKKFFSYPIKIEESFHQTLKEWRKPYVKEYLNLVDHSWFIEKIKSKSFVLTGRFHTITLCVKTETPFVALESNTPKISALLTDIFGSDQRVISQEQLKEFEVNIPEKYLNFSDNELLAIRRFNERAIINIDTMIQDIAKDISTHKN